MSSCKTGVRLAYPGHDKVASLHLFPRLMETLPEKRLPVIPLTAPAHTIIMYALWVQATMVLEGVSAENSAAHHEGAIARGQCRTRRTSGRLLAAE